MIDTYHSSLGPPLPPRQHGPRQAPVLIQPSSGRRSINIFCSILLLHLLITVGGFALLYHTEMLQLSEGKGKAALHSSENLQSSSRTLARMLVHKPSHSAHKRSGYLQWDLKHSVRRNINYFHQNNWLTILQPGDYLVVSRVTFSKGDPQAPLASMVKLKRSETAEETVAMQAYCSLSGTETRSGWGSGSRSIPQMCTASQEEVLSLERGNQLSVWVADLSLVDYSDTATSFGMYKL
ncbi:CD40 ligand [Dunckerocampus dactyliophorus]|uniref:CD40 ligand n=1 Tax=Dunckerocampus dactyliophorus TaxID=161453 RepID=UPI002404E651|nr:CD40 ligand [Dunckerocampus dactyliophorus]